MVGASCYEPAAIPLSDFLQSEGIAFETLDPLYDECGDFDTFNRAAAVRLLSMCESGPFVMP